MQSFKVKIIDPIGLHARPASKIVAEASKFNSKISILFKNKSGNLKSIMNVMSLGIKKNDEVIIEIEGNDEIKAIEIIKKVMKKNNLI